MLQKAADAGIKVLAYDRLIRDTDERRLLHDLRQLHGRRAAGNVHRSTRLEAPDDARTGPFNIELFAGSPDDNNAPFFFNGAMAILQPFIDNGTLVVKSGQTEFRAGRHAALGRRDRPEAHGEHPDATYSDGTRSTPSSRRTTASRAASSPLSRRRLLHRRRAGPIISGQDAELDSVKAIIAGEQYATSSRTPGTAAKVAVEDGRPVLNGERSR